MKNGVNPTLRQKRAIKAARLNPDNWLVTKNLPGGELHVIHRLTGKEKVISS